MMIGYESGRPRALGFAVRCALLPLICGALVLGGGAQGASTVPFDDTFSYPEGSDLNGTNGWTVAGDGTAKAVEERAQLQDAALKNTFTADQNAVTIDFDVQPVFSPSASFPSDSTFRFFVNTNGLIVAYNGSTPTTLTNAPLSESSSTPFQIRVDYPRQVWSLSVDGVAIANDLALSSGTPASRFEEFSFEEGSTNAFSYLDDVTVQTAISTATTTTVVPTTTTTTTALPWTTLPFFERFETLEVGDLDGQRKWEATDGVVQTGVVLEGSKAGSITNRSGNITHTFVDAQTNVWTDFFVRVAQGRAPTPPAGSTFAFYVNEDGGVIAYNGTTTQLVATAVSEDSWVRFSTHSDYANTNWDLYMNGRSVATDLQFYNPTVTSFSTFGLQGAGTNVQSYLDRVYIGTARAVSDGSVLIVR